MSEKKKNIVDRIGNKLRKGELPVSKNEWASVSKKLKFWDFFIPKFTSFNIYYLSAIVAASTITVYTVAKGAKDTKEEVGKQEVETLILQPDSLIISDTMEIQPEFEKNIETPEQKHKEETWDIEKQDSKKEIMHKDIDTRTIETTKEDMTKETVDSGEERDSISVEVEKEPEKTSEKELESKPKIQYIYQSDTIVIHDTIEKKVKKKKIIIDR